MAQSEFGEVRIFDDFLGPDNDLTWGTGTVKVGNFGFVSVNEGSFEWTVDESGGVLAITTDTGDDDNAVLMAGTFKAANGPLVTEWRFKTNSATLGAIYCGFTETLALDTPVMPAEFATATMTYNGTGAMAGIQFDTDGTTDDFRAVFGDNGAALSLADANGTRANATITADRWYIARTEIDPNGAARVYFGDGTNTSQMKLIKSISSGIDTSVQLYAVLMFENRSAAARVFEVDYGYARGYRDWNAD